jgi:hypothetical protein
VIETWLEAALTVNNHLLWGAGSLGDETKKIENKDTRGAFRYSYKEKGGNGRGKTKTIKREEIKEKIQCGGGR